MLKYTQRLTLKPPQQMVQQIMLNHIKGGRYEIVEKDRYEDKEELTEYQQKIEEAKKKLQWRKSYVQQDNFWSSKFALFASDKADSTSMDVIALLQTKFYFSWKGMKERRERKRVMIEKFMQQFIPERHDKLGNDLAAAHFVCFRGGSVKFTMNDKWHVADKYLEFEFPNSYNESYQLEGIRCDGMELYYEGLENIRRLKKLKTLSFRNVIPFDDWCLDRVSGNQLTALEMLDLRGTSITERGLCALYRIPTLKLLIVDDPKKSKSFEFHCLLLQEVIPLLEIVGANDKNVSNV